MKKVIYTVMLGKKYKLNEPRYVNKNWSFICFTDRENLVSKNWSIIKVKHNDAKKKSREIKIRCDKFLDFDICLYLDSKFVVKCDLDDFVKKYLKNDIAVMDHNKLNCPYKAIKKCVDLKIDKKDILMKQYRAYKDAGLPENFRVCSPGIMLRKNTDEVINFMKMWYEEIVKYSYRDIPSFSYILWKNPIKLSLMPFRETYFQFRVS